MHPVLLTFLSCGGTFIGAMNATVVVASSLFNGAAAASRLFKQRPIRAMEGLAVMTVQWSNGKEYKLFRLREGPRTTATDLPHDDFQI